MKNVKQEIIHQLKQDILHWQGYRPAGEDTRHDFGLGVLETAFPSGVFPTGVIHEFVCPSVHHMAASSGFLGGLLGVLMRSGSGCLWIGTRRRLLPESLAAFSLDPDRILFVDVHREQEVLWVMEEGLRCIGFAAVVAELAEISLTAFRRLQLAVEKSGVTGFVLRTDVRKLTANACCARWQVTSAVSHPPPGMPGLGHPRWRVELLKVRNGTPGRWEVEWKSARFHLPEVAIPAAQDSLAERKAG